MIGDRDAFQPVTAAAELCRHLPSAELALILAGGASISRLQCTHNQSRAFDECMRHIADPPIGPTAVRDAAVTELDRAGKLISGLAPYAWSRASAVQTWSVGDVVTHLDLFLGVYSRFLRAVLTRGGSGRLAKAIGWVTRAAIPTASPLFDGINGMLPRAVERILPPTSIRRQFAAGVRDARTVVLQLGPRDYSQPVYYEGGPFPVWFYLATLINELAIHGWDIESRLSESASLSDGACGVLPWFYWSGTSRMLRLPRGTRGTVQVVLSDTGSEMWWSFSGHSTIQGEGHVSTPDVEISGFSATYLLSLGGRLKAANLPLAQLGINGNRALGERFLDSWRLI